MHAASVAPGSHASSEVRARTAAPARLRRMRRIGLAAVACLSLAGVTSCGGGGDGGSTSPPPTQNPPPPPPPTPPTMPTGLHAAAGGDSVVLMWAQSTDNPGGAPITRYAVHRDGAEIAIADAATAGPGEVYQRGTRFIDTTITPGGTYVYRVQAIGADGERSALSSLLQVDTPAAGSTTPVPLITLDATEAPDLAAWHNDVVVPEVRAWYPKLADLIAYPDYTPPASFRIRYSFDAGLAHVANGEIVVNPDWARDHPEGLGVFVHEGAHVIQQTPGHARGWIVEGVADWAREFPYDEREPRTPAQVAGESYILGYSHGSTLLDWIAGHGHPDIIRQLTVAMHEDSYSDSLFQELTGRTADQHWADMTGVQIRTGAIVANGFPGRCVDNEGWSQDNGNRMITYVCHGGDNQLFSAVPNADGTLTLRVHGQCLDVSDSGVANGTLVQLWQCNGTGAQRWTLSGTALRNPNSGRCLDASDFGEAVQLRIFDCNGSAAQQWRLAVHIPVGRMQGGGAMAAKCLSLGPDTDNYPIEVDDCQAPARERWTQRWAVSPNADGTLTLELGGWCMDVSNSGVANGTRIQLWPCNGSVAQKFVADGGRLRNPNSGRCVEAPSAANGTNLRLWDCNSGDGQRWRLPT